MEIEEAIVEKLRESAAVAALVARRIYPEEAEQNATLPFVIYEQAEEERQRTLAGYVSLNRFGMHLDCYAATKAGAKALRKTVAACLDGFRGPIANGTLTVQGIFHDGEDASSEQPAHGEGQGEYRQGIDLSIWYVQN